MNASLNTTGLMQKKNFVVVLAAALHGNLSITQTRMVTQEKCAFSLCLHLIYMYYVYIVLIKCSVRETRGLISRGAVAGDRPPHLLLLVKCE